jgi:hypothetical protein
MNPVYAPPPNRSALTARVEQRFDQAGGHARLESELRRLAIDVIGRTDPDELPGPCRDAVLRMTRAAVAASVEPLVARFVSELARGVATLPEDVQDCLAQAARRRDMGYD